MSGSRVEITIDRSGDELRVRWQRGDRSGGTRFARVVDARPEWIAAEEDLLAGADRRTAARVLDELTAWGMRERTTIGIWGADGTVELLE